MIRAVLDTNIFISGAIVKEGVPGQILEAWLRGEFTLVTSRLILEELKKVFAYPKIQTKYKIPQADVDDFIQLVEEGSVLTPGRLAVKVVHEDPDDDIIVSCALEGSADCIVTGDPDLLKIEQHGPIKIITPRAFLSSLQK
jgi:putative PIN family toxin of toxin-antitoxin system